MTPITFTLFTLFVVTLIGTIYFRQLSINLRAILHEGAVRFNQQSDRIETLSTEIVFLKKMQEAALEAERSAQKALKISDFKSIQSQQEIDSVKATLAYKENNYELQKDFLQKSFEKERKLFTEELIFLKESSQQQKNTKIHPLAVQQLKDRIEYLQKDIYERDLKVNELQLKNKTLLTESEEKLAAVNPDKIASVKRRAAHYERLYVSMKSYREMSEDRLQNWENALRKLSVWVIANNENKVEIIKSDDSAIDLILNGAADPMGPLGPIVGLALEKIGTGFLNEHSA